MMQGWKRYKGSADAQFGEFTDIAVRRVYIRVWCLYRVDRRFFAPGSKIFLQQYLPIADIEPLIRSWRRRVRHLSPRPLNSPAQGERFWRVRVLPPCHRSQTCQTAPP